MNVETSFTDGTAFHADNSSSGHLPAMLTFESEYPTAVASNHRHRSVDSSGGLSERLQVGYLEEFQDKAFDFLTASHVG